MPTLAALVDRVAATLRAAGIENARAEARLIVTAATGQDRTRQLAEPDRPAEAEPAMALAQRRAAREPMAYLLGRREFFGLEFAVGPGVLVPRPETETLIEAALEAFPDRTASLRLLDLGTGTGCLLLTLLDHYPNATGIGVDRSATALRWAAQNRRSLGLEQRALLVQGDWLDAIGGPFDLTLGNPPYIGAAEPRDPETRFEPEASLLAGPDGLDAYRAIAASAARVLRPGGLIALEIGASQAAAVTAVLEQAGFVTRRRTDLAGRDRAVIGQRRD